MLIQYIEGMIKALQYLKQTFAGGKSTEGALDYLSGMWISIAKQMIECKLECVVEEEKTDCTEYGMFEFAFECRDACKPGNCENVRPREDLSCWKCVKTSGLCKQIHPGLYDTPDECGSVCPIDCLKVAATPGPKAQELGLKVQHCWVCPPVTKQATMVADKCRERGMLSEEECNAKCEGTCKRKGDCFICEDKKPVDGKLMITKPPVTPLEPQITKPSPLPIPTLPPVRVEPGAGVTSEGELIHLPVPAKMTKVTAPEQVIQEQRPQRIIQPQIKPQPTQQIKPQQIAPQQVVRPLPGVSPEREAEMRRQLEAAMLQQKPGIQQAQQAGMYIQGRYIWVWR